MTLHQARIAAQKVFAAKLEGRDLAAEKREAKRRVVADRVDAARSVFHSTSVTEPLRGRDFEAVTSRNGKALGQPEHS